MTETKVFTTLNLNTNDLISEFEIFGWEATNVQVASKTISNADIFYSITFKRDDNSIEKKFEGINKKYIRDREEFQRRNLILNKAIAEKRTATLFILFGILLLIGIVGLVLIIIGAINYSKNNTIIQTETFEINKINEDIKKQLNEVNRLRNSDVDREALDKVLEKK
jgi:hypothetical protein